MLQTKVGRFGQERGLPLQQRGTVAVMAGLVTVLLLAFLGLSVDLGHAYVGTSELQNSADAAALAGAKELDQTAAGVTAAVNKAIAIAAQHKYNFSTTVSIGIANIRLGTCPNASNTNSFSRPASRTSSCGFVSASSVTSDAQAVGLTFLEIDTGTQSFNTYFMRVAGSGFNTTSTAGYAVAGRFVNDITPIGVCAIDPANRTSSIPHGGVNELVEFGYRRGITYNLFDLNPLAGGPSDPYLINPVDTSASGCTPSHGSANFTAPFMCTGGSTVLPSGSGQVYTNTGMTTALEASLNSRFDIYGGSSVCDSASAPPDANVREYHCSGSATGCSTTSADVTPKDWMDMDNVAVRTIPSLESIATNPSTHKPVSYPTFDQFGVLWSYGPAYRASTGSSPSARGPFLPIDANSNNIYGSGTAFDLGGSGYPSSGTPYSQTSNKYFKAPPTHPPGVRNRRVLNIVLVDCRTAPVGPASCGAMTALGIGKFFMQEPAVFTGGPSKRYLNVEFAGLVQPVPTSEIKLYR